MLYMCLLNDKLQVNVLLTKEFEVDCSSSEIFYEYSQKYPFYEESVLDFACLRQEQCFGD